MKKEVKAGHKVNESKKHKAAESLGMKKAMKSETAHHKKMSEPKMAKIGHKEDMSAKHHKAESMGMKKAMKKGCK